MNSDNMSNCLDKVFHQFLDSIETSRLDNDGNPINETPTEKLDLDSHIRYRGIWEANTVYMHGDVVSVKLNISPSTTKYASYIYVSETPSSDVKPDIDSVGIWELLSNDDISEDTIYESGPNEWVGGVLLPNGKVCGILTNSTKVICIDPSNNTTPWIGVDLDGTLAVEEDDWKGPSHIGEPIQQMVNRVKRWLSEGKRVKILTARAASNNPAKNESIKYINEWVIKHIGQELEITAEKDHYMIELWDDRCVQVRRNTGGVVEPERYINELQTGDTIREIYTTSKQNKN